MEDVQSSAPSAEEQQVIDPRLLTKEQLIDELLNMQHHLQAAESEKLAMQEAALHMADEIERLELANSLNLAKLNTVMAFLIDPQQMTDAFERSFAEHAMKAGRDLTVLSKEMRPLFTLVTAALGHRILRMITGEMPTHVEQQ